MCKRGSVSTGVGGHVQTFTEEGSECDISNFIETIIMSNDSLIWIVSQVAPVHLSRLLWNLFWNANWPLLWEKKATSPPLRPALCPHFHILTNKHELKRIIFINFVIWKQLAEKITAATAATRSKWNVKENIGNNFSRRKKHEMYTHYAMSLRIVHATERPSDGPSCYFVLCFVLSLGHHPMASTFRGFELESSVQQC